MPFTTKLQALAGGLVVSCQAPAGHPLHGPELMAAMAAAAAAAGAAGIRANGADDVRAIVERTGLPVIGIHKQVQADGSILITPDLEAAHAVVDAGATVVALSCSIAQRPDDRELGTLIAQIRAELGVPVMADCATVADGVRAAALGADLIATTLSGYTYDSVMQPGPDLALVGALAAAQPRPVVAEGRIWTPDEAKAALDAGAFAVVVGTAITNPLVLTERFVAAMQDSRPAPEGRLAHEGRPAQREG